MPATIAIDARKIRDFGIGTYIRHLIRELALLDSANRYVILVGKEGRAELGDLPANFSTVVFGAPVYSLRELFSLSIELRRLRVDLYHATHYVLPFFAPCAIVVTIHDVIHLLFPEFLPNRLASFYARRMLGHAVRRADRIITVSERTRADLARFFAFAPEKAATIHNGVDARFHERFSQSELRARLAALDLQPGYLLFVGNPKPHKNLDRVLRAFAQALILSTFPGILVCCGADGPAAEPYRRLAQELGLSGKVRWLGHLAEEDLRALYQGGRLLLFPSLYEGFGLPLVEAMASGLPALTSAGSALAEIAAGAAALVAPENIDAIAATMVHLLEDETATAGLRQAGLERARAFDWRKTAAATLATYRRVLGQVEAA